MTHYLPLAEHTRHPRRVAAILVALLLLAAAWVVAMYFWNRPLGPQLSHSDPSIFPGDISPAQPASGDALSQPLCGGPPILTLLLIGSDSRFSGDYTSSYAAADAIRLVRLDFVHPSATMLVIPRDLWVPIPGADVTGVRENRIKTAYTYGNQFPQLDGGPSLLVQTLEQNFGLTADHYVAINFEAFTQGIEAIGGIDIVVPSAIDTFPEGWQHMDGAAALRYARLRPSNSSDLQRIDRQTQVITAIQEKLYRPEVLRALPQLITALQGSAFADLSPSEIQRLVCLGEQIPQAGFITVEIGSDMMTSVIDEYGYERLLPDVPAIQTLGAAFQSGDLSAP